MDKQEQQELISEIKRAYAKGDVDRVLMYAQELELRKVSDPKVLEMISDAFIAKDQPEIAREVLLMAYEKTPMGRKMASKLCELSIELGDLDNAVEFYEDFCKMAPHDNDRYLLKYKIGKAGGVAAKDLVRVLATYCSKEMDEYWMYELATLYFKTRQNDKCSELCDHIMVWFADGEYAAKAKVLKKRAKPEMPVISNTEKEPDEEAKLEAVKHYLGRDVQTQGVIDLEKPVNKNPIVAKQEEEVRLNPVSDELDDFDINYIGEEVSETLPFNSPVAEPKEVPFEDMLLEEVLNFDVEGFPLKEETVYAEDEEMVSDVVSEEPVIDIEPEEPVIDIEPEEPIIDIEPEDPIIDIPLDEKDGFENVEEENPFISGLNIFDESDIIMEEEQEEELIPASEFTATSEFAPEQKDTEESVNTVYVGDKIIELPKTTFEDMSHDWTIPEELANYDTEVWATEDFEEPVYGSHRPAPQGNPFGFEEPVYGAHRVTPMPEETEEVIPEIEEPLPEEAEEKEISLNDFFAKYKTNYRKPAVVRVKEAPAETTVEETVEEEVVRAEENIAAEENTVAEENVAAEEIKPEFEPEESVIPKFEPEESVIPELEPEDEPTEPVLSDFEKAMLAYDAARAAGKTEFDFKAIIGQKEKSEEEQPEELTEEYAEGYEEEYTDEYVEEYEDEYADEYTDEYEGEYTDEYEDEFTEEYEDEFTEEYEDEYTDEYTEEYADEYTDEYEDEFTDEYAEEYEGEYEEEYTDEYTDEYEEEYTDEYAEEYEDEYTDEYADEYEDEYTDYGYEMPEELKDELYEFLLMDGMEQKINHAIGSLIDKKRTGDVTGGHLLVTGDAKSGKTFLTIAMIKAVSKEIGSSSNRVAKVKAEALNGKNMQKVFEKINGSDLLIENVGYLSDQTVEELIDILEKSKSSTMVALEGNQLAVDNLLKKYPELKNLFKTRLDIEELSLAQWADLACDYAKEKGYEINDMALLALHAKIDELNVPTARLGLDDIKGIIDDAIDNAAQRNSGKFRFGSKKNRGNAKELDEADFSELI